MDGLAPEAGQSVATQRASKSSSEISTIKKFRYLNKLGQGFTSVDPLEEINIEDGRTLRSTFVNKTIRAVLGIK
jgi:hypothetical protein